MSNSAVSDALKPQLRVQARKQATTTTTTKGEAQSNNNNDHNGKVTTAKQLNALPKHRYIW